MEQAALETQAITRLALIKEASGLAVTVGGTVITVGAGGVLTGLQVGTTIGTAVIGTADAVIKVTKAGAELAIGRDGALDSAFEKSTVISTIANVNELLVVNGLFNQSKNFLDTINKLTWVTGKVSEVFQENKISFGAQSLSLSKFTEEFKKNFLARVKDLKIPTTFPGNYLDANNQPVQVKSVDMPQVALDALDALPVAAQLALVQELLPDTPDLPIAGNGITLAATEVASDETSITYSVSANIQGVTAPTNVVLSVANASVVNASRTITANGVLIWSVTVIGQNGIVTVTRSDNGGSLSTTLPGKVMNFDGTYSGLAITTFEAENTFCFDSTEIEVTVQGSVLSEDVVGTVRGNVVTGTEWGWGLAFTGTITGATMSGTWSDPKDGGCSGTFSLSRQ